MCKQKQVFSFVYDSVGSSSVDKGFRKSVSKTNPAAFGGIDLRTMRVYDEGIRKGRDI